MEESAEPPKGDCRICFTNVNSLTPTRVNSEKLLKNCGTYLDTSIFVNSFDNDNTTLSCCKYCYESVHELILLEEQVEKLQKDISDLSFVFSKNVLERRNRFTNGSNQNVNQSTTPPTKKFITVHKNPDSHSIVIDNESVKKEVTESESIQLFDAGMQSWTTENSQNVFIDSSSCNNQTEINNAGDSFSSEMEINFQSNKIFIGAEICWKVEAESTAEEKRDEAVEPTFSNESVDNVVEETTKLEQDFDQDPDKSYKCCICGQGFMDRQDLKDHYRMHNNKYYNHTCSFCDKSFAKVGLLKKHERICAAKDGLFTSSIGSMSFNNSSNLSNDNLIHTEAEGQLSDTAFCEKSFTSVTTIHSASVQRPYKCSFCEKSFLQPWLVKHHEKSHSEERPFTCSLCFKSFKNTHHLKSHQKYHSGDKPFKCSYCPKSFYQSCDAKQHEKTHSNDRPHKCPSCEKCFKHKHDLKTHHKRMHENKEEFILS